MGASEKGNQGNVIDEMSQIARPQQTLENIER